MSEEDVYKSSHGPRLVVFSGGTAINHYVSEISTHLSNRVAYILPVSDNGGSSSEIIRYLGGPAIGDIRSRLIRLASDHTNTHRELKRFLEHRLTTSSTEEAEEEFQSILKHDLSHPSWNHSSDLSVHTDQLFAYPLKRSIHAFLVYFYQSIQDKKSTLNNNFDFRNGSIGNFVFTGARLFFRSLDTAIYWFRTLTYVPISSLALPILDVKDVTDVVTIAAELTDGSYIIGQNQISHPLIHSSTIVSKSSAEQQQLQSPIKRIFYTSTNPASDDHNTANETIPLVNPSVLYSIKNADCVIYGMGSFYTSIIPSLIVEGMGAAIKDLDVPKILILNGSHDRETYQMRAKDFITAIANALSNQFNRSDDDQSIDINQYINTILYIDHCDVIDSMINSEEVEQLDRLYGIKCYRCQYSQDNTSYLSYEPSHLVKTIQNIINTTN